MTFRKGGAGKRRDANEPEIVEALRGIGCQVWQISGRGVPDLLVYREGQYYPMEVKTSVGKRTQAQEGTPWPVVRSVHDAIRVINKTYQPCEGVDPEPR
jgi:Holliday junction resolvase